MSIELSASARSQEQKSDHSSSQFSGLDKRYCAKSDAETPSIPETDFSLVHISNRLSKYVNGLQFIKNGNNEQEGQGMNFLAKHFFEYQSFINLPHRAVQLHKTPPSQAGADPSAAWAPKSMHRAGKNQAAPGARPNRHNMDTRPAAHRHGRAGKHEYREWGERHGELKQEKIAPHKDAWSRFLGAEEGTQRTVLECDFEEHILAIEPETLPERICRSNTDEMQYSIGTKKASRETEVLVILTYAPSVQFITVTVKKAKLLPFNNEPFARVMLFDGRRLIEQKQTTITTSAHSRNCRQSSPTEQSSSSTSSSSSTGSVPNFRHAGGDVAFSESFLFHVPPQKLDRCHLVIELFDRDMSQSVFPVGHCVIGPQCAAGGSQHWHQMLRKCGFPTCLWHRVANT